MKTTMKSGGMLLAALVLSGCLHANSVMLDPMAAYAPVYPDEVRIFLSPRDVPFEYVEIALVHADGDDDWHDEADVVEAIREEAASLGAHAVILSGVDQPSTLEKLADALVDEDIARRRGRAVAIRRAS